MAPIARHMLFAVAAFVFMGMGGCEDPGFGEVVFRNDTGKRIAMVVTIDGNLEAQLAKPVGFPATREPGSEWLHTFPPPSPLPAKGEPWCERLPTYFFVAPLDQSIVSTGGKATDPQLGIDDVDVIEVLAMPCWPGSESVHTIG